MDICLLWVWRVLSGRGLCDELITCPEESYRLWCVVVCDPETSRIGAPYIYIYIYIYDISRLRFIDLTLILLKWRKWWTNNARKWQMGFNSGFKGLISRFLVYKYTGIRSVNTNSYFMYFKQIFIEATCFEKISSHHYALCHHKVRTYNFIQYVLNKWDLSFTIDKLLVVYLFYCSQQLLKCDMTFIILKYFLALKFLVFFN
jgi:hypothetical protein